MLDALNPLFESGLINENIKLQINEAWESQLNEAKEQVRSEMRAEFADKYEHDRFVMVEALDKMMSDNLENEIREFHADRQKIHEDRVNAQVKLRENATKFNDFMITKLAEEIREVRKDRQLQLENQEKLNKFIVKALANEIKEFSSDRNAVVEAKVKLVAEGRNEIEKLKKQFVAENAKKVAKAVSNHLTREISQLKEDIALSRKSEFGRKIYEAYASEFSTSFVNEKAETRKLVKTLNVKDRQLAESKQELANAKRLLESKEREVRIIKESTVRNKELEVLLAPLNKEKAEVMKTLLESTQTGKLKAAFDKYLPAVLNNGSQKKKMIAETREVTGDKTATKPIIDEMDDNVIDIKRLAGL